jgi:hypothetical protein
MAKSLGTSVGREVAALLLAFVLLFQGLVTNALNARAEEMRRFDQAFNVICLTDATHEGSSGKGNTAPAHCEHPCCFTGRALGAADLQPMLAVIFAIIWPEPIEHRPVFADLILFSPSTDPGDGHIGARAPPSLS